MNLRLARRQFWILVMLTGVAWLWWRSTDPGRYAEWTETMDAKAALVDRVLYGKAWGDPWLRTAYSQPESSGLREVWVYLHGDEERSLLHEQTVASPQQSVAVALDDNHWIVALSATYSDTMAWNLEPAGDSAQFYLLGKEPARYWVPWSPVAVFEPALAVQASRFRGLPDPEEIVLVRFNPNPGLFLQRPVTARAVGDSVVILESDAKTVARLTWAHESELPAVWCEQNASCWYARDTREEFKPVGDRGAAATGP